LLPYYIPHRYYITSYKIIQQSTFIPGKHAVYYFSKTGNKITEYGVLPLVDLFMMFIDLSS